jgi:dimethylaniline monooxygenase (N-oxide forming)
MTDISSLPVCIIGAGSSGVTAAKALLEQDVAFDCYEIGSDIGGLWRYQNDNGLSSAYRSLHIDTSRRNLSYSDYAIPSHYQDFLSHFEVIKYLEEYADHFKVRPHIRFKTTVEAVSQEPDGAWRVTLHDGESRRYRAVLVANGHLWDARWAQFPGDFDGTSLHANDYKTPEPFVGKNVLVVGIGNSAVDIVVDVCKQAKNAYISTRRSAWIMPKYIMGVPTDRWLSFLGTKLKLPTRAVRSTVKHLMYLGVGNQARFGVPRPRHAIWREHATLSQELLPYVGHGWIKIKPDVRQLRSDKVAFEDGSEASIDAIIYATGYKTTFPFIDKELFQVEDGKADLYRRMIVPHAPGLFMVGLVQPVGPTIPLVEIQGQWVARVLAGHISLPERGVMDREIAQHRKKLEGRYVGSARYTLEVDFREYAAQMRRDMRNGKAAV